MSRPDAGGLTPSDLPLVSAEPEQIERWEARFPATAGRVVAVPAAVGSAVPRVAGRGVDGRLHRAAAHRPRGRGRRRTVCARAAAGTAGPSREPAGRVRLRRRRCPRSWWSTRWTCRGGRWISTVEGRPPTRNSRASSTTTAVARFDLARPPLLRLTLFHTAPERFVLALTNHHIILDGWSMPLLVRELLVRYAADGDPAGLPEPRPYRTYLDWLATPGPRTRRRGAWNERSTVSTSRPCWRPTRPRRSRRARRTRRRAARPGARADSRRRRRAPASP